MDDAGFDEAVRTLHDEHAPALLAWARRRTRDPREAEEIVQETLVRAWRKHDQYDPGRGSERAWLFGIARNVATDLHRRNARHLSAVPADRIDLTADGPDMDRVVEASLVHDALNALSVDHRAVLIEIYYRGRSVHEAAARLGIPDGTVKSRTYHALRSLRTELESREVLG
ncbi:MAG: sigma-70 family RNA polymerase sigma factor [Acidimicrobiales bacterium]